MPQIIIRLHPEQPAPGDEFSDYLSGLTITARDISFSDPQGVQIGQASYDPDPAASDIVQHYEPFFGPPVPLPFASAHIEIATPPGHPEHATVDVILEVRRDGDLVERSVYYNVPVVDSSPPDPLDLREPVAAYVALPDPGTGFDPSAPYIELPENGTPPPFDELRVAVEAVLANDPGIAGLPDLTTLTRAQSLHIARELLANRSRRPLPEPPRPLSELYSPTGSDVIAAERERFEADLKAYHGVLEAETTRLGRYVFALSAALANEDRTRTAEQARLRFPVQPGVEQDEGRIAEVEVILTN